MASLRASEELAVMQAFDLDLNIEIELRRRQEAESQENPSKVLDNHVAYATAFPLRQFVKESFAIVEQGREFKENWHIDIICELLQAIVLGQVRNFIINIPRRTMKSTLVCVMFPCWVWTFLPHLRFLFTSYSADFAKRDNEKCRDLVSSAYYQQRWGDQFHITTDRRNKIANTKGGSREVFKIGKGTGSGGDIVIADDPNAIDEVESELILKKTNNGWNEVSYHNVTDRNTASRGIIQQRTASDDLTGNITDDPELSKLYSVLCLAMRYEPDNPLANTPDHPLILGKVSAFERSLNPEIDLGEEKLWVDPRDLRAKTFDNKWYRNWYKVHFTDKGLETKGEGQLLWESYITEETIKQEVSHLKAYGESSQYQQRPIARGGNFFKSDDFVQKSLSSVDLNGMSFCRYWDKAATDGAGDWTVGMLMGRTQKRPYELYIIDIIRRQVGYYERMQLMKDTAAADTRDYIDNLNDTELTILIEKEGGSGGKDLTTIEKDALLGYHVIIDKPKGKKAWRAKPAKSISEAGRIKVIKAPWNVAFFRELEKFKPENEHGQDDQIDTLSGSVKFLIFGQTQQRTSSSGAR